ncbi:hypothetical protein BX616_004412 [Lobosporangium transversale]|uniref:Protein kinase domain-containing protein n=1 Tax=Lobosporangium transversale TaxID=64571 RepID=A0A1Y2GN97_9FUNG|nr:hypothetical protein BCR41DRAFT_353634 [Lobosporangium transversale]KAF9918903.1 hypothetical protein BX616_004412 [Lobosporangium transversale]ORZ16177.1 hypothetical protein BCR41DRAFT_353634 [Lobosporangium transversale]|eukprot:XP_021881524.1 hypothetical protein BCR41DRAFT_353634 [Lobosporangium transversale]
MTLPLRQHLQLRPQAQSQPQPPLLSLLAVIQISLCFVFVVNAVPAPPPISPGPVQQPLLFSSATVCSGSNDEAWIVGADKGKLTFVKIVGSEPQLPAFKPAEAFDINEHFNGGKCIVINPTTIYYVADSHMGYLSINTNGSSTWHDWAGGKISQLDVAEFRYPILALGYDATSSMILATVNGDNNVRKWDVRSTNTIGLASLSELGIPDSKRIISMTISSGSGASFVWFYYSDSKAQSQLLKVNLNSKMDQSHFTVSSGQVLVPLAGSNGVALLGPMVGSGSTDNTLVSYYMSDSKIFNKSIPIDSNTLQNNMFIVKESEISQLSPSGPTISIIGRPALPPVSGAPIPPSPSVTIPSQGLDPNADEHNSTKLPIILGSVLGFLALVAIIIGFLVYRNKKTKYKQKNLFPIKTDETMVPLGLYHNDRSLPEVPHLLENDLQRLGYGIRPGNRETQSKNTNSIINANQHSSMASSQSHLDETIPVEAALKHHRYDMHTPQGLAHSVSVSSTTSNFARRNGKSGKRFEEKIQLQVIRYEIQDAHLISPHGPTGRLVLGTYHVVSLPRSARSIKAQGGDSQALARSGTVVVRRSRLEFERERGRSPSPSPSTRPLTPLRELAEGSSMLLTDAENQHTFEAATLKWYMTEIHWKREAALLKHLKSPIFVMELLESYCIPALQNRANTYPFINAMGGCSSLLSDLGPVKTAQHARAILRSISAAVDWCHRHGVVHLNIQPGSFFIEDGIDPKAEDAPWKLWDFTCARFIGEPIGAVGGGGNDPELLPMPVQPPPNHLKSEAYPYLEQQQLEQRMDRIGGNPLPAAYTAPELLEAWRAGDTTFPAEAVMDTWSLGCVYYEILTGGRPLFQTESDAWALIGGWNNQSPWTARNFRVPYPPASSAFVSQETINVQAGLSLDSVLDTNTPYEKSQILDPSGSITRLLHDMMNVNADERISLESIMERIY